MEKLRVEFNFHQAATILLAIVQSLASQVEPMSTLLLKTSLFLPITIYTKSSQTKSINMQKLAAKKVGNSNRIKLTAVVCL